MWRLRRRVTGDVPKAPRTQKASNSEGAQAQHYEPWHRLCVRRGSKAAVVQLEASRAPARSETSPVLSHTQRRRRLVLPDGNGAPGGRPSLPYGRVFSALGCDVTEQVSRAAARPACGLRGRPRGAPASLSLQRRPRQASLDLRRAERWGSFQSRSPKRVRKHLTDQPPPRRRCSPGRGCARTPASPPEGLAPPRPRAPRSLGTQSLWRRVFGEIEAEFSCVNAAPQLPAFPGPFPREERLSSCPPHSRPNAVLRRSDSSAGTKPRVKALGPVGSGVSGFPRRAVFAGWQGEV